MKEAVCTLFERHYHYGVAVLTNSLVANGFSGHIYAGYRGDLPAWANAAKPDDSLSWEGSTRLQVEKDVCLHFLPIRSDAHFTNFKAHFMLDLLDGPASEADALFYFDPDIVCIHDWNYFREWIQCGVILCEDVNSPVWKNSSRRIAWRNYFKTHGYDLKFKEPVYVNGGFLGVDKKNRKFIEIWRDMMEILAVRLGGMNRSKLGGGEAIPKKEQGAFAAFGSTDQDALNCVVEAYDGEVSFAGKEAMAFIQGASLIPHALGYVKPWMLNPVMECIKGKPLRTVDKVYWNYAHYPLKPHSGLKVACMKILIKISSFISRFYKR